MFFFRSLHHKTHKEQMQGLMKWILLDMSQKLTVEVKQRPLKSNGFAGIVDELNPY